ncbi:MAG TPA: hypothetical protein VJ767_02905 [Nitrososphaeraceae archaeon]|nr:hypothetical protein [Nitrososphaeraceae archaeon]
MENTQYTQMVVRGIHKHVTFKPKTHIAFSFREKSDRKSNAVFQG